MKTFKIDETVTIESLRKAVREGGKDISISVVTPKAGRPRRVRVDAPMDLSQLRGAIQDYGDLRERWVDVSDKPEDPRWPGDLPVAGDIMESLLDKQVRQVVKADPRKGVIAYLVPPYADEHLILAPEWSAWCKHGKVVNRVELRRGSLIPVPNPKRLFGRDPLRHPSPGDIFKRRGNGHFVRVVHISPTNHALHYFVSNCDFTMRRRQVFRGEIRVVSPRSFRRLIQHGKFIL